MLRAAALVGLLACLGCRTVPLAERSALADPLLSFDADLLGVEMRGHIESPREGAVGGFSPVGAGGCGCN